MLHNNEKWIHSPKKIQWIHLPLIAYFSGLVPCFSFEEFENHWVLAFIINIYYVHIYKDTLFLYGRTDLGPSIKDPCMNRSIFNFACISSHLVICSSQWFSNFFLDLSLAWTLCSKIQTGVTWLAETIEHVTVGLRVVNLSPSIEAQRLLKNKTN